MVMDTYFLLSCSKCKWFRKGDFVDFKDLKEFKPCATCHGFKKYKCPQCANIIKLKRVNAQ